MEPITCLDCGFPLGQYYEAFMYMRETYLSHLESTNSDNNNRSVHIDRKWIDAESNESLVPIFNALKIEKYCCRGQLASCKNMHDVGY